MSGTLAFPLMTPKATSPLFFQIDEKGRQLGGLFFLSPWANRLGGARLAQELDRAPTM